LQLTPAEFGLLLSLAKAHGRVKTREQLIEEVADREWDVFDRAIDMHISTLRKKLGDDPKEPRFHQDGAWLWLSTRDSRTMSASPEIQAGKPRLRLSLYAKILLLVSGELGRGGGLGRVLCPRHFQDGA